MRRRPHPRTQARVEPRGGDRRARRASERAGVPGQGPLRTCVGCRRVRPQALLLRIIRTRAGLIEPDPYRREGGRGAYLCFREGCLTEALRRGRWAQTFRAPAAVLPETIERLRALVGEDPTQAEPGSRSITTVSGSADRRTVRQDVGKTPE